jgi:pycsar effector protein
MNDNASAKERVLPRLLASNALRANLSKHMVLNQMADSKAGMILTAASLITTIALTQIANLPLVTVLILAATGIAAVVFSIIAISPPLGAKGRVNLFYFRSFVEIEEEEFISGFKDLMRDREKLYDAYLHEIYYLGRYRLTRKYALVRNGLWTLLIGLVAAAVSAMADKFM